MRDLLAGARLTNEALRQAQGERGGVASHAEMMDKLVGYQRIREITARATIKEGYGA